MKRGKARKEVLDIHNEIKVITLDDSTFELWNKVISNHDQGKLYDTETNPLQKFKETKSWTPEKNGFFNREFFKWLRNFF
jgi:hypothetical protein